MAVDLIKNSVLLSGAQEDISGEVTVSETIRLNDNMSSISKILFCGQSAVVRGTETYLGGISVKGEVNCTILYLGENGATDSLSAVLPFEYLKDTGLKNGGVTYCKCSVAQAEILPMKQRRMDVNITVSVNGFACDEINFTPLHALDGVEGMNYLRDERKGILASTRTATKDVSYTFSAGPIIPGKILYAGASINDVTTNASTSGVLVNAMVNQYVVYTSVQADDTVSYHTTHDTYAVNQFIESDYGHDFDTYDVTSYVAIGAAQFIENEAGEYDIELNGTMSSSALLISHAPYSIVCDFFSTAQDLSMKTQETVILKNAEVRKDPVSASGSVRISNDGINRIAASQETLSSSAKAIDGVLYVTGTLTCNVVLLKSASGEAATVTLSSDFEYESQIPPDSSIQSCPSVNSISYDIMGDELSFKADIVNSVMITQSFEEEEPVEVTASDYGDDEDNYVTVKVRYISEDENLWSLAKENRASIAQILAANNLESEDGIRPNKPLIIRNF